MKDLKKFILENTVVDFGKATSTYGECIILAGGGGSGKGFIKNRINANFRTYDVDDLKFKYTKLLKQGKLQDKLKDFDFSNPDDVTELHMRVKQHGWKDKQILLKKHLIQRFFLIFYLIRYLIKLMILQKSH